MVDKNDTAAVLIEHIIEAIEDVKGENILTLDLRNLDNSPCNFFVICSGNSNTQVNAIENAIQKKVSRAIHEKPFHIEGSQVAEWVLLDYINVVVHIFQKHIREYYNIEELWGDAITTHIASNY